VDGSVCRHHQSAEVEFDENGERENGWISRMVVA
jgi:hypothetical protein